MDIFDTFLLRERCTNGLDLHLKETDRLHVVNSVKKKLRPETYESKGYAGHRRSGDGAPSTPVRGHQVASEHHRGTSERGGRAELGK